MKAHRIGGNCFTPYTELKATKLTQQSRVLEKPIVAYLLKFAPLWIPGFITLFKRAYNWTLFIASYSIHTKEKVVFLLKS
jgi:hypothetical protein